MSDAAVTILNVSARDIPRYLVEEMLRREGFEVLSVGTGGEALEAASVVQPDLVVLEVKLPDLEGHEVCRQLKQGVRTASIPVLLTSASLSLGDKVEGLESGADSYLVQPFDARELIATVRALLRVRTAERKLREALAEREEALAHAREALAQREEALRVRTTFLSAASHELRTPLTSLLLRLETLQVQLSRGTLRMEGLVQRVEGALQSARSLRRLVDTLLDVTRLEQGQLQLKPEPAELGAIVEEAVEGMNPAFEQAGCVVDLNVSQPVWGVWDKLRLGQVFTNLLSNALKYGAGAPIHVRVVGDGDKAVVSVRDEGPGIAPEDQARIFERFERACTNGNIVGFGLGLWIARQLVDASGGSLIVRSEPGRGAEFQVRLACRPELATAPGY